jgi:hypothetical protein
VEGVTVNAVHKPTTKHSSAVKDQSGPAAGPNQVLIVVPPERQPDMQPSRKDVLKYLDLEANESRTGRSDDEGSDDVGFVMSDLHHSEEEEHDVEDFGNPPPEDQESEGDEDGGLLLSLVFISY